MEEKREKQKTPTKGSFLIANPRLQDPNFNRTVVLMCEYNEEGAFGLIVNRAMDLSVSEVLKDNPKAIGNKKKVFSGGPVQTNHLLYLHNKDQSQNKGQAAHSKMICDGVSLGGDTNDLDNILSNNHSEEVSYRLFLGSAGWAADQLDEELKVNSWVVCPAKENFIFDPEPEKLWQKVLRSLGGQYAMLASYPPDPILN